MEKIKQNFSINSLFIFLFIILFVFLNNDWHFLFISLLAFTFFLIQKFEIEINDFWFFYVVSIFISAVFSHSPFISIFSVFKWFLFWLFYKFSKSHKETQKSFIFAVVLISFVASIILLVKFFSTGFVSGGIIGRNINYTSVLFVLSAIYFFYSLFNSHNLKYLLLNFLLTIYFLSLIVIINSRGALLAFFVSCFLILINFKKTKLALYFLLSLITLFLILPENFISVLLKLDEPYSYKRIDIWLVALKGFSNFPIYGYGSGLFENIFSIFKFRKFDGISFFNHTTSHAHSEILNILSETGIVAGVFFALAFINSFISGKNNIFKFFILAIFIQSSFDVVFYLPLINLIFMISAGYTEENNENLSIKFPVKIFSLMAVMLICVFPYFKYKFLLENSKSDKNFQVFEINKIDFELIIKEITNSIPNSARIFALSSYATNYYPNSVYFLFEKAKCLIISQNYKEAEENLKKAIFLEPYFNRAHLALAEIYLKNGEIEKAKKSLKNVKLDYQIKENASFYEIYLIDFDYDTYKKLKARLNGFI